MNRHSDDRHLFPQIYPQYKLRGAGGQEGRAAGGAAGGARWIRKKKVHLNACGEQEEQVGVSGELLVEELGNKAEDAVLGGGHEVRHVFRVIGPVSLRIVQEDQSVVRHHSSLLHSSLYGFNLQSFLSLSDILSFPWGHFGSFSSSPGD